MSTIVAQIGDELDRSLTYVAKEIKKSKSGIVLEAIKAYVQELQEDIEDYKAAMKALKKRRPYTVQLRRSYRGIGVKG